MKKKSSKNNICCINIEENSLKGVEVDLLPPLKNFPVRVLIEKFYVKSFEKFTTDILRDFFSEAQFSALKVRLCLERVFTIVRYIELPKMTVSEFKNVLKLEVEKCLPFPVEEVYFDGDILKESGDKMKVVIAACKKELIDSILKSFGELNIEVEIINLESLALINLFESFFKKNIEIGLLNIGNMVSSFTILSSELPFLTRVIALGKEHFLRGKELKTNFNFFDALIKDIKLTLDYFETQTTKQVKKIFLTGEGVYVPHIINLFEKNLNLPIERLSLENKLDFKDLSKKSVFFERENLFHSCLGLVGI